MKTNELVNTLTDKINTLSFEPTEFLSEMSNEHRTLQQSFTRLCFEWIKHVASEGYATDFRNEASKTVCSNVVKALGDELYLPLI